MSLWQTKLFGHGLNAIFELIYNKGFKEFGISPRNPDGYRYSKLCIIYIHYPRIDENPSKNQLNYYPCADLIC